MQRLAVILLLFLASLKLFSQENRGFRYYDSLTYNQYLNGDWTGLSNSASEAISLGHDYYYMRMRKAISLYERKNYLIAIKHFTEALTFNPKDPIALEYIYYCYLLSGRESNAVALSRHFSDNIKKKINIDKTTLNSLSLSALYQNSSSDDLINDIENVDAYGEEGNIVIARQFIGTKVIASHYLGPVVKLKHAATYIRKKNFLNYYDGTQFVNYDDQTVNQFQYYISMIISSDNGWRFAPAFHFMNTAFPLIDISNFGGNSRAYTYDVKENSIIAGASLEKTAGIFDFSLAAHFASYGSIKQGQGEAGIIILPFGNNKLNIGYMHNLVFCEQANGNELNHVSEVFTGFSVADAVWIDISAIIGKMSNFHSANGLYVYNDINNSDIAGRIDITIPISEKGAYIFLGAAFSRNYSTHIPAETIYPVQGTNSFNNISISGGLSWKF